LQKSAAGKASRITERSEAMRLGRPSGKGGGGQRVFIATKNETRYSPEGGKKDVNITVLRL